MPLASAEATEAAASCSLSNEPTFLYLPCSVHHTFARYLEPLLVTPLHWPVFLLRIVPPGEAA